MDIRTNRIKALLSEDYTHVQYKKRILNHLDKFIIIHTSLFLLSPL